MMVRLTYLIGLFALLSVQGSANAGWPFFAEDGLKRGTPEYYEARASDPPGTRQKYAYGKLWPPQARPSGPPQTFIHKYHAAHYWPQPYTCDDRSLTAKFFSIQVANGWEQGTTLFEYHFDPLTHELNSAGHQHLHWIMTNAPAEFRHTFVASTTVPQHSNVRLANVERAMAGMTGAQAAMPVSLKTADSLGRPAGEVDRIFTSAAENMPAPSIIYKSASSGD